MLYFSDGKPEPGGLPSFFTGGAYPPNERKEGVANDYIFGSDPILYTHCRPCRSVLSDLQGKEIAATTTNSDGCYIVTVQS